MKENIIGAIIIVAVEKAIRPKTLEEQKIQDRILNLSDCGITELMQLLGKWDSHKRVKEYTAENIGKLVTYGNDMGWDVELEIEVGHDYHLVGERIEKNGVHTYRIYGIHNEFDEWASLLDIHALVGFIASSKKAQDTLALVYLMDKANH